VACGDSGPKQGPGGSATDPLGVRLVVDRAAAGCDEDSMWRYSARTQGWAGSARVDSWSDADAWHEEHSLVSWDYAEDGAWDELVRVLNSADADAVPNSTTRLACGVHDVDPDVVHALRVYSLDGTLADCVVWSVGDPHIGDPDAYAAEVGNTAVHAPEELGSCVTL
jgi:hypothetical protein